MRLAILAGLLAAAACSPYGFDKEIGKFSDGVNALSGAFDDSISAARNNFDKRQLATYSVERPRDLVARTRPVAPGTGPT